MRVQMMAALAALLVSTPAFAQNSVASMGNQSASSASAKSTAKARKAAKQSGQKSCRRLAQGKVCMTAEKWKEYEQMM